MKIADDDLVTREGASRALDRNVRTIGRALAHVEPDDEGPPSRWRLSTVREALAARAERVGDSYGGGNRKGEIDRVCWEIERLAEDCQRLLDRLEEMEGPAQRWEFVKAEGQGHVIGRLFAVLDRSLALDDETSRPVAECYVNREIKGRLLGRIFHLLDVDVDTLMRERPEPAADGFVPLGV
jgi:hypothetical protein